MKKKQDGGKATATFKHQKQKAAYCTLRNNWPDTIVTRKAGEGMS